MSLYGMMRTSASGMAAQANRLGAVSDNIANSSTDGYKAAGLEFSTLVLEAGTSDYAPGAVESHILHHVSQQGAFKYTASTTDIALKGEGFMLVQGGDGRTLMTRAGSFVKNGTGDLVNAAGYELLGYNILGGSSGAIVNAAAGLSPVNLNAFALQATPSTAGELTVNLPSTAASVPVANLPSTNTAASAYTAKSSIVTYDNLGTEVTLDIYSTNTGGGGWDVSIFNRADAGVGGGFPYAAGGLLKSTTLQFDPSTGRLITPASGKIAMTIPNGSAFTLDMSKATQLATDYNVVNATANGNAPASVESVEISSSGVLSAVLKNGSRIPAFQIPVARVVSPDRLTAVAGNAFQVSEGSGNMQIGSAGTSGNAEIVSSALEQSTVDLASELTDMIQAQSSYTSNSKVFQVGADLVSVLNNLRS